MTTKKARVALSGRAPWSLHTKICVDRASVATLALDQIRLLVTYDLMQYNRPDSVNSEIIVIATLSLMINEIRSIEDIFNKIQD